VTEVLGCWLLTHLLPWIGIGLLGFTLASLLCERKRVVVEGVGRYRIQIEPLSFAL